MVSGTVCHLSLEMIRIPAFTAQELFWEPGRNVELQVDAASRPRDPEMEVGGRSRAAIGL